MLFCVDVDVAEPDEKSVITYVSSLYEAFPDVPSMEQSHRDTVCSHFFLECIVSCQSCWFLYLLPASLAGRGILLSCTCTLIHLLSLWTQWMNRFRCQLARVIHGARAWNCQLWGSGVKGQGHTRPQIDLEVLEAMSVICLLLSSLAKWRECRKCCHHVCCVSVLNDMKFVTVNCPVGTVSRKHKRSGRSMKRLRLHWSTGCKSLLHGCLSETCQRLMTSSRF